MGIENKNGSDDGRSGIRIAILKLVNLCYQRVFHENMSLDVQTFLKNLLFVGVATIISTLCTAIFNILGGRLLGPQEYGKFILIQSVAMFLYFPMELGLNTAMLKYTSEKHDYQRQSNIIKGTLILATLFSTVSIVFYIMIATPLSHLFSISINLFYLAVAFAVLFVFFTLTMSAVRGLNRMRAYSVFQIVYGPIVLISFLVFIFNHQLSFETMVFPILAAYISLTICTYFIFIRKLARWKFDISTAKMLWKFSIFSAIGGLSYAFYTNVDRIMIGRYLPVGDVGIYAAYYTASINIAGLFWGMFNMVYFPTISGYENKGTIFVRINKLIPFLISLGIPFLIICEYIVLKLYGASYSLNIFWMLFFSVTSICVIVDGLYGWLLQAIGLQGIKITSIAAVVIAVVNTGLNLILIPKFGIAGAIICLMISYIISIIIKLTFGRNYLLKGEE